MANQITQCADRSMGHFGLDTEGQHPEQLPEKCVKPFPESQLVVLVNRGTVNLNLEAGAEAGRS